MTSNHIPDLAEFMTSLDAAINAATRLHRKLEQECNVNDSVDVGIANRYMQAAKDLIRSRLYTESVQQKGTLKVSP